MIGLPGLAGGGPNAAGIAFAMAAEGPDQASVARMGNVSQ
jgi:hypothetical protein